MIVGMEPNLLCRNGYDQSQLHDDFRSISCNSKRMVRADRVCENLAKRPRVRRSATTKLSFVFGDRLGEMLWDACFHG
jgi:hypothetical protein